MGPPLVRVRRTFTDLIPSPNLTGMGLVHWLSSSRMTNKIQLTEVKRQVLRGTLNIDSVFPTQGHGGQKRRRVGHTKTLTFRTNSRVTVEIVYRGDCTHRHNCRHQFRTWNIDTLDAYRLRIAFQCVDCRGWPYDNVFRLSVLEPRLGESSTQPTWRELFEKCTSVLRSGESLALEGWTPRIERRQSLRILPRETRDVSHLLEEFENEYGDPPNEGTEEDEYSSDVAKYMLELEAKYVLSLTSSTNAEEREEASTTRRKAIELIEHACESFACLLDTLWLSIHIFDRFCLSQPGPVRRWQLLSVVCFLLAVKSTETRILPVSNVCDIVVDSSDFVSEDVLRGELVVLQKLNYDVFTGYSPWFWICGGEGDKGLTRYVQDFLIQIAISDEAVACVRPSLLAAAVLHGTKRMGLMSGRNNQKLAVLRERYGEKEVMEAYRMLMKKLDMAEEGRLYGWYAGENRCGASKFVVGWAKGAIMMAY